MLCSRRPRATPHRVMESHGLQHPFIMTVMLLSIILLVLTPDSWIIYQRLLELKSLFVSGICLFEESKHIQWFPNVTLSTYSQNQGPHTWYSQNIDPLSGTSCAWLVSSQSLSSTTPFEPAAVEKRRLPCTYLAEWWARRQLKGPRALKTCCHGVDLTGSGPKRLGKWAK